MHDKHWTDDELISKLFDLGPEDGHLEACPECTRRWETIKQKHERSSAICAEVPDKQLAAQRQAVLSQLNRRTRKLHPILVPSLATAFLLVLGSLVLFKAYLPKRPAPDAASEDKLIEEVYQISLSAEPTAMEPVQALFEEQQ